MSNNEALKAIKFADDQMVDGKLLPAYKENSLAVSLTLDYIDEKSVPIAMITVGRLDPIRVTEGKYKSAIWVWYWICLNGGRFSVAEDGYTKRVSFKMNPAARASAKAYFGEETCKDAKNNEHTIHTFVRELLYAGDVEVTIDLKEAS